MKPDCRDGKIRRAGRSRFAAATLLMLAAVAAPLPTLAQTADADIALEAQLLENALIELSRQTGVGIFAPAELVGGLQAPPLSGRMTMEEALLRLLDGTGLGFRRSNDGGYVVLPPRALGQSAGIEEVIVTGQKRAERLQDVPIAISAFTTDDLSSMKIEGGSELLRAIPNVSFSKSNFSMYNFSIRGIGTKAVSASSDPAVAVSFNSTPLLRNRLFEQEYLDVERIEVLRGPQGTLYGRNATAGVVNMIPNLPQSEFEALVSAEVGNYNSKRASGMLNLPMTDTLWMRVAGAMTQRDGFDYNSVNRTHVNDRDLWSARLSLAWAPTDRLSANVIWERFREDDNRARTGKQLCTPDPGPEQVGSVSLIDSPLRGRMSQGCLPSTLFSNAAYGTPNASGMSQLFPLQNITFGRSPDDPSRFIRAFEPGVDPYDGVVQSTDLREIATFFDPVFRAQNDVYQLNVEYLIGDGLRLVSQTAYAKDDYYSTQDYSRYLSNPIFGDSFHTLDVFGNSQTSAASPHGIYNDPQLGPSSRMLALDMSRSDNEQTFQELRLQSEWDGRFNFSVGANYLDFKSQDDYFVFNNTFSYAAEYFYNQVSSASGPNPAISFSTRPCDDSVIPECMWVDMSPLESLVGDGHNYFRSKNVVRTQSWGLFGEGYFELRDDLRLTLGLRYTSDRKTSTPYPSQLLLGSLDMLGFGPASGGYHRRGYPAMPDIVQSWDAVTGRLVLDWKPTEHTMLYASYARGYKGGGANPPRADINPVVVQYQPLAETFEPEHVNAFEIGSKSSFYQGRMHLNATAFFYDYSNYQVSQIVDRISLNENFDAQSMGLELELAVQPLPQMRVDANFGYLRTRIASGEGSIDVMNRTQGNPDWMLLRPWAQVPSNCIAPVSYVEAVLESGISSPYTALTALCGGAQRTGSFSSEFPGLNNFWELVGVPEYNPFTDAPNGGRGFTADLGGNELPNAPRFTGNVGVQYTFYLRDWDMTVRGDYYRQSGSYFRVYNTEYDRLRGWGNANLLLAFDNPQRGLSIQFYAKNLFNDAPIVDAFTNSDDTMLTTNVFTLDPRLIGVSLSKRF